MGHKFKIAECIRQGAIGGGESHLLSLVENLDRSQFEPIVLSFTPGPMVDRLKEMGVETHIIHTERPFDLTKWKKVKHLFKEKNVQLVHAHGTRANSNVFWAAKSLAIPLVYTVHGWSFHQDQRPFVRTIRIAGEKVLTSKSDLNISVSESNQQTGKDFINSFESIVINNGIDQNKFNPSNTFNNIREQLSIPVNKIVVLFIARFTEHKQPLSLIEAYVRICRDYPDLHLLMVGDGDQKTAAEKIITEHGLSDRITLLGFRQDVPDILAAADIFVLPSLWEGLPIGLLEALAMGKSVIATDVDGTKEIIENEVNGILISTNNLIDNLCESLITLVQNAGLRKRYSAAAIKTVNERFNAANMTRKIEQVYRNLINQ